MNIEIYNLEKNLIKNAGKWNSKELLGNNIIEKFPICGNKYFL